MLEVWKVLLGKEVYLTANYLIVAVLGKDRSRTMELDSILKIIDAVSQSEIMNFEIEDKDFRLFIDKNVDNIIGNEVHITSPAQIPAMPAIPAMPVQPPMAPVVVEQKAAEQPKSEKSKEVSGNIIKSPIVGTFYSAPGPEAEDYVKVGDKVRKGQVLCIIEAMKLMNEIESEFDGEIAEILVKNEQMVEFGQPLFKIV